MASAGSSSPAVAGRNCTLSAATGSRRFEVTCHGALRPEAAARSMTAISTPLEPRGRVHAETRPTPPGRVYVASAPRASGPKRARLGAAGGSGWITGSPSGAAGSGHAQNSVPASAEPVGSRTTTCHRANGPSATTISLASPMPARASRTCAGEGMPPSTRVGRRSAVRPGSAAVATSKRSTQAPANAACASRPASRARAESPLAQPSRARCAHDASESIAGIESSTMRSSSRGGSMPSEVHPAASATASAAAASAGPGARRALIGRPRRRTAHRGAR